MKIKDLKKKELQELLLKLLVEEDKFLSRSQFIELEVDHYTKSIKERKSKPWQVRAMIYPEGYAGSITTTVSAWGVNADGSNYFIDSWTREHHVVNPDFLGLMHSLHLSNDQMAEIINQRRNGEVNWSSFVDGQLAAELNELEREKIERELEVVDKMTTFINSQGVILKEGVNPLFDDVMKQPIALLTDSFVSNHVTNTPVITGGNRDHRRYINGNANNVSLHRYGLAIDVGFNAWRTGISNHEIRRAIGDQVASSLRNSLGEDFDVVFEVRANSSHDHIHIEYDPTNKKAMPSTTSYRKKHKIHIEILDVDRDEEIREDRAAAAIAKAEWMEYRLNGRRRNGPNYNPHIYYHPKSRKKAVKHFNIRSITEYHLINTVDFEQSYCFNSYLLPIEDEQFAFKLSNKNFKVRFGLSYVDHFQVLPQLPSHPNVYKIQEMIYIELANGYYIKSDSNLLELFNTYNKVVLDNTNNELFEKEKNIIDLELPPQ